MPWRARKLLPDFSTGLADRDAAGACSGLDPELLLPKVVEPRDDSGGASYSLQSTAYSLSAGEARAGLLPPSPRIGPGGLPYRLPPEPVPMSQADVAHVVAHYDGALNYADMWLGIFLDGLEKKGLLANSVVLVAGDHGEALGDHGRFGHGFQLAEFTLHVPLIVSGPGIARNRRIREVVELADLAPTALDLAGMVPCHAHRGRSLGRHLRAPEPPLDLERAAFSLSVDEASIRTVKWFLYRLVSKRGGEVVEEYTLYDIERDEAAANDLAAARPEVVAQLKSRLLDWLEQTAPRSMGPKQKSTFDRAKKQLLRLFGYW
jgi:arylsulfatase A-like enzyme